MTVPTTEMNATESGDELLDGLLELVARDAAASARCCASPGACGSTSGSCSSLLALESPHPSAQEPPKAKRRRELSALCSISSLLLWLTLW